MKTLLGIQLNSNTSVQLLRACTFPGIPYLLLDSAVAESPICAPHWNSEKQNSGWGEQCHGSTGEALLMSPPAPAGVAAWQPELQWLAVVGQAPRRWGTGKGVHLTPGCSWCAVLGGCCPMARLSKAFLLGTCWSLTRDFPWLCNTFLCCRVSREFPHPKQTPAGFLPRLDCDFSLHVLLVCMLSLLA